MRLLCIKKKYAALLIDKKGNFKRKKEDNSLVMLTKGIVLARRDNNKVLRSIYTKILDMIMDKQPLDKAIAALVDFSRMFMMENWIIMIFLLLGN